MLQRIVSFFVSLVFKYGTVGIFLGLMAESMGIPAASSVLDLTSGALIKQGQASFVEIVLISSMGVTVGSVISYFIGYIIGESLAERFFRRIKRIDSYERAKDFLKKRGETAIFLAQLFGTTRTWVSLPAGIFKMDLKKFTLYTFLGGATYCVLVTTVSYFLYEIIRRLYEQIIRLVHIHFWAGILISGLVVVGLIVARSLRQGNKRK